MPEDKELNLRTIACPINFVRAKLAIDSMNSGEILKLELDNGEPVESVSKSMKEEGHELLDLKEHDSYSELWIKKLGS